MLLEFRVENYRCFASEAVLRLTASKDTSHEGNIHSVVNGGFRVLKSAVVYGANGSGKSTLIQAASLMRDLVLVSATLFQANQPLPVDPFRLDPAYRSKPSSFEMTFLGDGGIRYQYGFSATKQEFSEEWLYAYPHGRRQVWFERGPHHASGWYFGPALGGERDQIRKVTRPNGLYLSTAANMSHPTLTKVFSWFQEKLLDVTPSLRFPNTFPGVGVWIPSVTAVFIENDPTTKESVAEFIRLADVGIEDISLEITPTKVPAAEPGKENTFQHRSIKTKHKATDGEVWFDLGQDESLGTRELFDVAGLWVKALKSGGTLLVDEALSALHPILVRHLFKVVHEAPAAQLVMATHDTTLLDPRLLRRDQIYFTEKDKNSRSHLYSLLEFKPRKGEAFSRGYLSGRYGALPFIGDVTLP